MGWILGFAPGTTRQLLTAAPLHSGKITSLDTSLLRASMKPGWEDLVRRCIQRFHLQNDGEMSFAKKHQQDGEPVIYELFVMCHWKFTSVADLFFFSLLSAEEWPCAQPSVQVLPGRWHHHLSPHEKQTGTLSSHQRTTALHVPAHPAKVLALSSCLSSQTVWLIKLKPKLTVPVKIKQADATLESSFINLLVEVLEPLWGHSHLDPL